jgi:hypothetical protein
MLRTPTARPVPLPALTIVDMGLRLLSATPSSPIQPRTDSSLLTDQLAGLPRLHLVACQLTAQTVVCVGDLLTSEVKRIVDYVAFALSTYDKASPVRPVLCSTVALVVGRCGIPAEEGGNALARVFRMVLEGIAAPQGRRKTTSSDDGASRCQQICVAAAPR